MTPHRLYAKLFVENASTLALPPFVSIFHAWIQEQGREELLIDVHDYKHVHEGPGILLVGHEADYALDLGRGRPGLLYRRKRALPETLRGSLALVLRQLLAGALRLQDDAAPDQALTFRTDEIEIGFPDRLQFPNDAETFDRVQEDLAAVLTPLYGGSGLQLARLDDDSRQMLALHVRADGAPDLAGLLQRVETRLAETA